MIPGPKIKIWSNTKKSSREEKQNCLPHSQDFALTTNAFICRPFWYFVTDFGPFCFGCQNLFEMSTTNGDTFYVHVNWVLWYLITTRPIFCMRVIIGRALWYNGRAKQSVFGISLSDICQRMHICVCGVWRAVKSANRFSQISVNIWSNQILTNIC